MNARRLGPTLAAAILAMATGAATLSAATPKSRGANPAGATRPNRIHTTDIGRRIDVNQINMFVTNIGSFAFNLSLGDAGLFWPRGTDKSAVFASGLWLGAQIAGEDAPRVTVAEYSQEYGPGAMTAGGGFENPSNPANVVYKVVRYTGNPSDTAHVERTPNALAFEDELVHHSWSEYMAGAVPRGAPWRLYHLPDPSTSDPDDFIDVPGPDVLGDMMLWSVYNDADAGNHTNGAGNSLPLGIEIQQTTFAFDRLGALGQTVFIKYKLKNKGTTTLDEMFVSQWSDPDLGGAAGFTDDLVGCDTLPDGTGKKRSLGFVYNSTDEDGGYGKGPPALGYDFFQGPSIGDSILPLTSFNKYINGTDPASPDESYSYMSGLDAFGDPVVDPFGNETRFVVAGDPVSPDPGDWLDAVPADRRMMLSSGPFTMAPGDSQEVVVGIIVGQGKTNLSSISALRFNDEFAQDAFDKDFDLPSPPPQPEVDVTVDHEEITLSWDAKSRTDYEEPGYTFEGYNVYQGATVAGPWTLMATYDEVNGTRVIFDRVFDPETGQLLPEFPTAFGSDLGVRHSITIREDAARSRPLRDGTEYYFAVTSYSYNPTGLPKVLENAQRVVRATPQRPAAGTDLETASATEVTYTQGDPSRPPSTEVVSVDIVDPSQVTGHDYRVEFVPLDPPQFGQVGQDTATARFAWNFVDVTDGDTLLANQINQRNDLDYQVVDGIRVRVVGAYFPQLQSVAYRNLNTENRRPITGNNWSGNQDWFFGGAGYGSGFLSSSLDPAVDPDSFSTVQIRFDTATTQRAYRYIRWELGDSSGVGSFGDAPPGGRLYEYAGYRTVPFTVWDVVNNVPLDAMFVERGLKDSTGGIMPDSLQPATFDSTWAPSTSAGDREYLIILRSAYTATAKTEYEANGQPLADPPALYGLWAVLRTEDEAFDNGDRLDFVWAVPATPNDVYTFSTRSLVRGSVAVAQGRLGNIRAVPNPYYTRSTYELNQFNRKIKFINLPEVCTVRIYNLAGQLVRTLRKTDGTTSILEWDIETEGGLPVGSGVYLFHVESPAGEYSARLAVFMEKERLNSY